MQDAPERFTCPDVHGHRWLVKHDQLGISGGSEREADALALPGGELICPAPEQPVDPGDLDQRLQVGWVRVDAPDDAQQGPYAHPAHQLGVLQHCADPARGDGLGGGGPEQEGRAVIGIEQSEQHLDGRGLARTIGS